MSKSPLISVLMPVYNGEKYVTDAVTSVLSQTYKNWELIIVDDASTDKTPKLVRSFVDKRIRHFTNNLKLGLAENRNRALSLAEGDYIAILDSDDISDLSRFEKQIHAFVSDERLVICGTWAHVIDKDRKHLDSWQFPETSSKLIQRFYLQFPIVHSSTMYKKSVVDKLKLKYDPAFAPAEDYDFLFKLTSHGKLKVLPEFLVSYRLHDDNSSKKSLVTVTNILPNLYVREYSNCGLIISLKQARNIALFLNPNTGIPSSSISALKLLLQLGSKLKRKLSLSNMDRVDWYFYILKCFVLQIKLNIF